MGNARLTSLSDIQAVATGLPPKTVIIPGGDRVEDLQVAATILGCAFIKRCLLVGDRRRIMASAADAGLVVAEEDVIGTGSQEETASKTVELVRTGEADIVLKGNISTPVLNREMLKIKTRDTISLATIFQAPSLCQGRPVILTDAGFTTVCNIGRLTGIIENAAEVARSVMGIPRPKVALLSANEKVIPSLLSTRLEKLMSGLEWRDMDVSGPLSFDLATDPNSVRIKGVKDAKGVAGNADILVCPGLDSANILYKVLMSMTEHGLASTAGVTLGVQVPYIILSRADSEEAKINSVALCCIFAERRRPVDKVAVAANSELAEKYHLLAVNPVVSDEFCPEARVSGYKGIERKSAAHALSVKRLAAKAAEVIGHPVEKLNLVVAHMGGEIMIAAIREGRMVDNNIAIFGGGPFTPARVGNLPMKEMIDLCFSGQFTKDELQVEMSKRGGLTSLLGTHNMVDIEKRIEQGDKEAELAVGAMAYQVAKEIGAMYVAAGDYVEAIVCSGGLAKSKYFMGRLKKRIGHLAQVIVFKGNVELEAMAQGALDVLTNK